MFFFLSPLDIVASSTAAFFVFFFSFPLSATLLSGKMRQAYQPRLSSCLRRQATVAITNGEKSRGRVIVFRSQAATSWAIKGCLMPRWAVSHHLMAGERSLIPLSASFFLSTHGRSVGLDSWRKERTKSRRRRRQVCWILLALLKIHFFPKFYVYRSVWLTNFPLEPLKATCLQSSYSRIKTKTKLPCGTDQFCIFLLLYRMDWTKETITVVLYHCHHQAAHINTLLIDCVDLFKLMPKKVFMLPPPPQKKAINICHLFKHISIQQ